MKSSVDKVASMQNDAKSLSVAYESGDRSVDLTKVMLEVAAASKSAIAAVEKAGGSVKVLAPKEEKAA